MRRFYLASGSIVPQYSSTEEDKELTSSSTSTSTTTTSTSTKVLLSSTMVETHSDNVMNAEQSASEDELTMLQYYLSMVRERYADVMGKTMPGTLAEEVQKDLIRGGEHTYWMYALAETAKAPHPSWRYTCAIVMRLKREKVPAVYLLDEAF